MQEPTLTLPEPAQPPVVIGQALLFSPEIETAMKAEERQGRYTLERFKALRPKAYEDCIALLAAAKPGYEGLRRIAGIIGCHHLTVAAVRDDQDAGKTIDTLRERLSRKALTAVEFLIDRVLECPGSIPAGMIGMHIDQLTKVGELLGNRATQRTQAIEPVNIYENWEAFMEQLVAGQDEKIADAHEVSPGPEMGLGGGNLPAIEAPSEVVPASDRREMEPARQPQRDAESPVSRPIPEASTPADTTSDTEPSPAPTEPPDAASALPDARNGGGRGSARVSGGAQTRSGYSTQKFSGNRPPLV